MTEIRQTFTIDASQALSQITKLNAAFGTLTTNLNKTNKVMVGTGKAGAKAAGGISKVSVSMQTLARIVTTQVIVRAMSRISVAMKKGVQDAIDFEKQVAEISTISSVKNLDQISSTVAKLSSEFNKPLGDVAKGLYQTISNQIADAGEATQFMSDSLVFAKVAVTDTDSSVNLLSGVLNAYGKSAGDAANVSAKLFKTIELGRTTGPELASSLGKVLPVAGVLGIRLEEVTAALADMTLSGVKTNEATTQLRGLMNALLKPTKEMKAAMLSLGFATGEQAITALGLQGTFKALASTTDGSAAALSKLVPRIRGLNAFIRIGVDENSKYAKSLKEIDATNVSDIRKEFERIVATDAEKLTRELNKIKNLFTTEIGKAIIEASNTFIEAAGGADGLEDAIRGTATAIEFLGKAAGGAAAIMQGTSTVLAKWLALINGDTLDVRKLNGESAEFKKAIESRIQSSKDLVQARLNDESKVTDKIRQGASKQLSLLQAAENRRLNIARATDKDFVESRNSALDKIVNATKDAAKEQLNVAQQLQQDITASERAETDIKFGLDAQLFQSKLKALSPQKQFTKLLSEQNSVLSQTNALIRKGDLTQQEQDKLDLNLDYLDTLNSQSRAIAQQTNDRQKVLRVDNKLRKIAETKLAFEDKIQRVSKESIKTSQDAASAKTKEAEALEKAAKAVKSRTTAFAPTGELLSDSERAKNEKKNQQSLEKFRKLAKGAGLSQIEIDSISATPETLKTLNTQIQNAIKLDGIDLGEISATLGVKVTNLKEVQEAFKFLEGRKSTLAPHAATIKSVEAESAALANTLNAKLKPALDEIAKASLPTGQLETFNRLVAQGNTGLQAANKLTGEFSDPTRKKDLTTLTGLQDKFNSAITATAPVVALQELNREINKIATSGDVSTTLNTGLSILKDTIESGLPQYDNYQKRLQVIPQQFQDAADKTEILNQSLEKTNKLFQEPAKNLQSAIQSTDTVIQETAKNTTIIAENALKVAQAAQIAASASALASGVSPKKVSINPKTANYGRMMMPKYFANGGRGNDQIPAMLAKNERVINARSSRNFASQLEAINAGHKPIYRENGGPVTNITVGDINVRGGETSKQTARTIASELKREFRRNTSSR